MVVGWTGLSGANSPSRSLSFELDPVFTFTFAEMRVSSRILQSCRITLFTREHCGLCTQARSVLSQTWDKRPFVFKEIDIIKPEAKAWRDLYDLDVPVVS